MRDILNLAYLRIIRKWKNSLLFFLVLLLSFASAIVSVSVVGSIDHTNAEYRLNTYGEWYFAIPYGYDRDGEWLSQKKWVDSFGTAQSLGTISASEKTIGLGTIDEKLIDIGRIRLDTGSFPSSDNEIAMEADSLSALGYDYTLGQNITITISLPVKINQDGSEETDILIISKTYTLCGIIHEYSDLWYLQSNVKNIPLNSAVVSDTTAAALLAEADEVLPDYASLCQPVLQYFISVSEENRAYAKEELDNHLYDRILIGQEGDAYVCVNTTSYTNGYVADQDDFYMYIIALLTFISILCLEIIRLPSDTHSFSVLRSVGMSKGQLGLMQIFETLILGIPAILLGLPLGAGLTWLVLRLMLYSGSVPIQVHIPYQALFFILALWLAAILISRFIIFVFTLRVPMIGRFQMNTAKSRGARLIRSGFIVLLLFVSSASVIFTGMESIYTEFSRQRWASYASYELRKLDSKNPRYILLSQSDIEALEIIPGISDAYGFSELYIGLSFDGLSEEEVYLSAAQSLAGRYALPFGMVYLFVIDENDWTDTFDFEGDTTAFHNGEFVYVSSPDSIKYEFPMPEDEAVLHIYGYTREEKLLPDLDENDNNNNRDIDKYRTFLESYTVKTKIMHVPQDAINKTVAAVLTPYTVICSEQFFQNLLETLPEGKNWSFFTTGGNFGYGRGFAFADVNSSDLSTDIVIAKICKERELFLSNHRQINLSHVQEEVQSLIMLYFSGACICIIALMILWSNVSLEAKNEKRGFLIKRCIGMSKRQVDLNIFGKSLLRCLSAFLFGWLVYIVWAVLAMIQVFEYNNESWDLIKAIESVVTIDFVFYFRYYPERYVIVLLLGLVLPLMIILYAKKDLSKDGDIK